VWLNTPIEECTNIYKIVCINLLCIFLYSMCSKLTLIIVGKFDLKIKFSTYYIQFNLCIFIVWLCILNVCLCMTTLTEVFPCFFLSCKANTRVKPRKDGTRPALFLVVVSLYVFFFLLFCVFLCSLYCLFCEVSCIVCVYMCTEQLPPGGYPVAVKYIS